MYSAYHELKVPFLLTLMQTLTKFAMDSLARVLMFIAESTQIYHCIM